MKKLTALLLCSIVLWGCKKTDNQSSITIAGKWTHVRLDTRFYDINDPNTLLMDSVLTYVPGNYVQFNQDGTGVQSNLYQGFPGTTVNFQYTVTGTTLNLTGSAFSIAPARTILQLDTHNLIIHYEYTYVGYYNVAQYKVNDYYTK